MSIEQPFFDPSPTPPEQESPSPCDREIADTTAEKVCAPSNQTISLGPELSHLQVGGGYNGMGAIFFDPERFLPEQSQGEPDELLDLIGPISRFKRARWSDLDPTRTYLARSFERTYSVVSQGPEP